MTNTATVEWSQRFYRIQDGKGWKPSGLAVTKAKWWIYVFAPDAFIAVEVARLQKYLDINNEIPVKEFAKFSNNPTKGYLLFPEDVSKLLSSEVYDTVVYKK